MTDSQIFNAPRGRLERIRPFSSNFAFPGLLSDLQGTAADRPRSAPSLGRVGALEVRLAQTAAEIRQAQKLRYRIFYREGTAIPNVAQLIASCDIDDYDAICDHLLVLDHAPRGGATPGKPEVVGTCRLLRQPLAEKHRGFYSAGEFDTAPLIRRHADLQFLELGRSCILAPYRNRRTVELLWHGIWAYVLQSRLDVMIGCASLDGTEPERLALPLSFLHHHARAPALWRARALPARYVEMRRLPKDAIDVKKALRLLPPLLKGYLRLGAFIGDGAVVDRAFGTTDVLVVLPVSAIKRRYLAHFDLSRRAA